MTDPATLLRGCSAEWLALFARPEVKPALAQALNGVAAEAAAGHDPVPSGARVFEAFRCVQPSEAAVVIVGQDPYHTVRYDTAGARIEQAQGLCFSCNPLFECAQPSLQNVRDAVAIDLGFDAAARPAAPTTADVEAARAACEARGLRTRLHDLRFWAAQGVLLLNRALTTRAGHARSHTALWEPFTRAVVRALAAHRAAAGRPTLFALWGNDAKELGDDVRAAGGTTLCWSHPSPLGDRKRRDAMKFRACGHFLKINAELARAGLRQIVWFEGATVAACDGGCTGNGRADADGRSVARAGFGVTFCAGPLRGLDMHGAVAAYEYAWVDPADPLRGIRPTGVAAPATNNRGEYLAGCYLLLAACRAGLTAPVYIVTDSNLFLSTMTAWLPDRRKKGTAHELKNFDLVAIAETLVNTLTAHGTSVTFLHQRSHQPEPALPDTGATAADKFKLVAWKANDRADRLATRGVEAAGERAGAVVVTPPVFAPLARC